MGPPNRELLLKAAAIYLLFTSHRTVSNARCRFGASGLRIFRLLLLKGQLEQKQVADFSMLSPRETRELLYRMLKGGFLALQVRGWALRSPRLVRREWRISSSVVGHPEDKRPRPVTDVLHMASQLRGGWRAACQ